MNEKSTDKTERPRQPPPPPPDPAAHAKAIAKLDLPKGIPVQNIRLVKTQQMPGYGSTDTVSMTKLPNGCFWEIEFIPQMRHHRVTFTDPSRPDRSRTALVHETHVASWEPAI